jgi:hypothetical protein
MPENNRKSRPAKRVEFVAVWSVQAARWEVLNSRSGEAVKLAADEREAKALARNLNRLFAAEPRPEP